MPDRAPKRTGRLTVVDVMILVASTAALLVLFRTYIGAARLRGVRAAIHSTLNAGAVFLSLGGLGACAARLRGRPRFEGFCWGFICGPFGALMIGLMPHRPED